MILFDILKSNQNNYKMKFLNFCFAGILGSVLLISITGSVTRGPLSSIATTTDPVPMCRDTSEHCAFWGPESGRPATCVKTNCTRMIYVIYVLSAVIIAKPTF